MVHLESIRCPCMSSDHGVGCAQRSYSGLIDLPNLDRGCILKMFSSHVYSVELGLLCQRIIDDVLPMLIVVLLFCEPH